MLPARLLAKVRVEGECWLWTGAIRANGYGAAWLDGKHRSAHRVFYEDTHGPIPVGRDLDHLCRVRACVRPEHLEPVDRYTNLHRSSLTIARQNAEKTRCPANHPYDAANTYHGPNGHGRQCRECMRERVRQRRAS